MKVAPRYWAVVPAAGVGSRMEASIPKQYLNLAGKTVLERTLERLLFEPRISKIIVAISPQDEHWRAIDNRFSDRIATTIGGKERADSVLAGLEALADQASDDDWILVHDAARPCVTSEEIDQLIGQVNSHPVGGILAQPLHDTLKKVDGTEIQGTIDRKQVWRALTPQMFRFGVLKKALEQGGADKTAITDESSAIEALGLHPLVVEGKQSNLKITRPADLALAEFYLESSE